MRLTAAILRNSAHISRCGQKAHKNTSGCRIIHVSLPCSLCSAIITSYQLTKKPASRPCASQGPHEPPQAGPQTLFGFLGPGIHDTMRCMAQELTRGVLTRRSRCVVVALHFSHGSKTACQDLQGRPESLLDSLTVMIAVGVGPW